MKIKKIISHENYGGGCSGDGGANNDIALVQLEESLNSTYMPACLPPKKKSYTGKLASVYGWGLTVEPFDPPCNRSEPASPVLRTTNANIISNEQCKKGEAIFRYCDANTNTTKRGRAFIDEKTISDDMICIESPGRGICNGDSGGPATIEEDGKHILVGASSWVEACGKVSISCF